MRVDPQCFGLWGRWLPFLCGFEKRKFDRYVDTFAIDSCFNALLDSDDDDVIEFTGDVINILKSIFVGEEGDQVLLLPFLLGLSVFCDGSATMKVSAACDLFGSKNTIGKPNAKLYLACVYKMLYTFFPKVTRVGVTCEELATMVCESMWNNFKLDASDECEISSFLSFFVGSVTSQNPEVEDIESSDFDSDEYEEVDDHASMLSRPELEDVRKLTKLNMFGVNEVCEIFEENTAEVGVITYEDFCRCFELMAELGGGHDSLDEEVRAKTVISKLFEAFDANKDGSVDSYELISGLSVLCNSSQDDKVKKAFELFDFDGDGSISLNEMSRYLQSVFRILYEVSPSTATAVPVTAEELAIATARQCFKDADKNQDGKLSFEEFQSWYASQ